MVRDPNPFVKSRHPTYLSLNVKDRLGVTGETQCLSDEAQIDCSGTIRNADRKHRKSCYDGGKSQVVLSEKPGLDPLLVIPIWTSFSSSSLNTVGSTSERETSRFKDHCLSGSLS